LHRIDRGGEVTHHLPGQLVAYPVLDLQRHTPDLHWYLRQLELVVIDVLADLGLQGECLPGLTGVWVGQVQGGGDWCGLSPLDYATWVGSQCGLRTPRLCRNHTLWIGWPSGRTTVRLAAWVEGERCAAFAPPVARRPLPPGVDPAGVIRLC
jgi:lipoyl(octanoyl) transferase